MPEGGVLVAWPVNAAFTWIGARCLDKLPAIDFSPFQKTVNRYRYQIDNRFSIAFHLHCLLENSLIRVRLCVGVD